ncbi:MAG: ABC-2 family transporter protein [Lachnospiraceae bacterium]|nr:ABC-2 family transporter protein [Lachnospiraceae bacterium]
MKKKKKKRKVKTNRLHVYTPFGKSVIKDSLAYKGSFYLFVICKVLSVFITYYLWRAIFSSSDNSELGGFNQVEILTYVFMSFVCSNMVYISMTTKIGENVVDGSIAINLIKPISYKSKLFAESIGEMIYKFIVPSVFVWIGLEVYKYVILDEFSLSGIRIALFLLSSMLSFIIYFLFEFCFGMIAFYSTYVWGMEIIKNSVLSFLTGQIIPLTFFPDFAQKLFNYLPFSSMNYVPVMIYLGKISSSELIFSIERQILWILILELISIALWRRVVKRISILGG